MENLTRTASAEATSTTATSNENAASVFNSPPREGRSLEPSSSSHQNADRRNTLSASPPVGQQQQQHSSRASDSLLALAGSKNEYFSSGSSSPKRRSTADYSSSHKLFAHEGTAEARTESRTSIASSLYSLGSALMNGPWHAARSSNGSLEGSTPSSDQGEAFPSSRSEPVVNTTPLHVSVASPSPTSASHSVSPLEKAGMELGGAAQLAAPHPPFASFAATARAQAVQRPQRGRPAQPRKGSNAFPRTSGSPGSDRSGKTSADGRDSESKRAPFGVIGFCALDAKARSKPCRNILNRINANQEFDVIIFGDKVILDEEPENWPLCDYFISFFSSGFPLDKAIKYEKLRRPFSVNDLHMQKVLWDRRVCLYTLDRFQIRTPTRVEVNRDGGPRFPSAEMAHHVYQRTGLRLHGPEDGTGGGAGAPKEIKMLDDDTLYVDGKIIKKPFVEKPVSGEDHNVHIYYAKEDGGGGRRLFRKINNKSSEPDENLNIPRCLIDMDSSYIYEQFLDSKNAEDVKAYTVGSEYCHAETRKSPVVDGIVKRNTHGKEMRYITSLNAEELKIAAKVAEAFGQRVCGFDLLRSGNKSYVIDVNGWSFVKDNNEYYDKCASILRSLFINEAFRKTGSFLGLGEGDATSADGQQPRQQGGHFSALKSILRSPSISRHGIHPHLPGHGSKTHSQASPDISAQTTPLISASTSTERPPGINLPRPPTFHSDLPPPVLAAPEGGFTSNPEPGLDMTTPVPLPASRAQWRLKGMVAVVRHADRTPKQKLKFTFHTKPFVDLLKGHDEEVLLVGEAALNSVSNAAKLAIDEGVEDKDKLRALINAIARKGPWPGTKVQIKPMFRKRKATDIVESPTSTLPKDEDIVKQLDGSQDQENTSPVHRNGSLSGPTLSRIAAAEDNMELEKLQLIVKWGGEPTHSARYQSKEYGENFRNDLLLMNRETTQNLSVFSSSERRVVASADIWTKSFLDTETIPKDYIKIRKDLLDDSNAAKDVMDRVKKKLKGLLREGHKAPAQFAWPENMPEPYIVARNVVGLMTFHREIMRHNFKKLELGVTAKAPTAAQNFAKVDPIVTTPGSIEHDNEIDRIRNLRWCSGEDSALFRERWNKLFDEFTDPEKVDPSKISELHDTMKFDALHNRRFLEWVFTPPVSMLEEFEASEQSNKKAAEKLAASTAPGQTSGQSQSSGSANRTPEATPNEKPSERSNTSTKSSTARRRGFVDPRTLEKSASDPATQSYFNLFSSEEGSKEKIDVRLRKLRELFLYSKILFDFIGPQEYGIEDSEKLEIGLLTSLPLLRAIVNDLEEVQASEEAKTFVYFTKESHIYTLLNSIIEGGIRTKIARNKIPELDYLSTICFELYESQNSDEDVEEPDSFNYSIRITISPGCHTFEPLDVQLDAKHCIGFAQRRSLTAHNNWKEVIETLRAKFHTVNLPKSFVAVNISEKADSEKPVDIDVSIEEPAIPESALIEAAKGEIADVGEAGEDLPAP